MRIYWTPEKDQALRDAERVSRNALEIASRLSQQFGTIVTVGSVRMRRTHLREVDSVSAQLASGPGPQKAHTDRAPPPDHREPDTGIEIPIHFDEPPAPPAARPALDAERDDRIARLVEFTKKPRSLEEVCDELELAPKDVKALVAVARERAHRIDVTGHVIGHRPAAETTEPSVVHVDAQKGGALIFGAVGDVHHGSKHHLADPFRDYCEKAFDAGAKVMLCVGDLLDGVYRHSEWEQNAHGFEAQAAISIRDLPRRPGVRWIIVPGNHDQTFEDGSGIDVSRATEQAFRAAGRTDVTFLPARGAYVRLVTPDHPRGLYVHIWHPSGRAAAYAKSYKLQKKIEGFAPGAKPDVCLMGHYHQSIYLPARGMHGLGCGCWQGGDSSFGRSLVGAPDIGSWIVRCALTSGGTVRDFEPRWVGYQERETVRDVALG